MRTGSYLLAAAALAATLSMSGFASAQQSNAGGAATAAAAGTMMGQHEMPAIVENVDHKTGLVTVATKVDNKGHALELHFPPDAVKDLKKGDKITVLMGFHKD